MHVKELVDEEADIIWGSTFNGELEGRIRVSVVATGIDSIVQPLQASIAAPSAEPAHAFAVFKASTAPQPVRAPVPAPAPPAPALSDLVTIATCLESQAFQDEIDEDELLLTVERELLLTPPEGASEFVTIDPFAAESDADAQSAEIVPIRGPSLFERMALAARGAVRPGQEADAFPPPPHLYRGRDLDGPAFAKAA
jgi:cell division protein FtsZ